MTSPYDESTQPIPRPSSSWKDTLRRNRWWAVLAVVVVVWGGGIIGYKVYESKRFSDSEKIYLDVVSNVRADADWKPWPDDDDLVTEGHLICQRLRKADAIYVVIQLPFDVQDDVTGYGSEISYQQAHVLIVAATKFLCPDQRRWFSSYDK